MTIYFAIAAAVFGAIVGSFLNALSFRWGTGRSIIWALSTSFDNTQDKLLRLRSGHAVVLNQAMG